MHGFPGARALALGLLGLSTASCVHRSPGTAVSLPRAFERPIQLNGYPLTLHLSPGVPSQRTALVLYATGDGGWRGKDRDVYTHLRSWGYAVVGFSAPEYLKHLPGNTGTTTPARLAADFARIIAAALPALELPESAPVILVGVSRGADLAVVAAGQPDLQAELGGVVVMGLTREEEYVHRRRRPTVALDLYSYLPRLGNVPLAVIQSTRDNYLAADEARTLFGEDTPRRTFRAIDARNHSFAGARPLMYTALRSSLSWIDRLGAR